MTRLSVIIPAFNAAPYLAEAIESVAMQQLQDLEVVIVNDASTDATASVLQSVIQRHPALTIRQETNPVNSGGGATRNRCVALAKGSYLFNLDADNMLSPGLLRALLARAEEEFEATGERVMVSPHVVQYFSDRVAPTPGEVQRLADKSFEQRWIFTRLDRAFVLTSGFSPASTGNYLYHRSIFNAVGGYFEDCGPWDAWSFGARTVVHGFRFVTAPDTFYLHRRHNDSYWTRNSRAGGKQHYFYRVLEHFKDVYTEETRIRLQPDRADYPPDPFLCVELR